MADYKLLDIERRGDVFLVTLSNGDDNRLNVALCQEIIHFLSYARNEFGQGPGALIVRGNNAKFFTNGVDLEEVAKNPYAGPDGFYPLLHAILDFPFPTIAMVTGHTFGGGCPFSLAFDYRIMNVERGFFCMPAVDLGMHFPGIGSLLKSKLPPQTARRVLLEGHRFTGKEALEAGIVDAAVAPEKMLPLALEWAEKWKGKAAAGVYGLLREELQLEPMARLRNTSIKISITFFVIVIAAGL
ncbi:unnamed protein product [Parascedosporium putredinis]|uniref:ClpP/crotonase-like domain-containing protein n=1 Tax=Parascedosporium putredinis TaxID=1442378 RepID=A0A9P1H1Q0_9PEZI|nr:unnamed protein product [Parascedosporium putredinis]CAI7993966.1 unnamed protein product [Parascedosporium putredinis]